MKNFYEFLEQKTLDEASVVKSFAKYGDLNLDLEDQAAKKVRRMNKPAKYAIFRDEVYVNKAFLSQVNGIMYHPGLYRFHYKGTNLSARIPSPKEMSHLVDAFHENDVFLLGFSTRPSQGFSFKGLIKDANAQEVHILDIPKDIKKPKMKVGDSIRVFDSKYQVHKLSPKFMSGLIYSKNNNIWTVEYEDGEQESFPNLPESDRLNYNFIDRVWEFR